MERTQRIVEMTPPFRRNGVDPVPPGLLAEIVEAIWNSGIQLPPPSRRYRVGDIEIDEHLRTVFVAGREVHLTPKEYDLLIALARRNGAPVSKRMLASEVWDDGIQSGSRTIDQHIVELRRKLEPERANPRHIRTVRKFGYCLREG